MKVLVIGGSRYFGKRLVDKLVMEGHEVTLLNRGSGSVPVGVQHIKCDRGDRPSLQLKTQGKRWDVIFDQICMSAPDAHIARDILVPKASKYVLTSSMSVYNLGSDLKEEAFEPAGYTFSQLADPRYDYAEAKRQVESVLSQDGLPITCVRFPIVLGIDDFTKRLVFHIEKMRKGERIYFPDLKARLSFINSSDAADALDRLGRLPALGSINVASEEAVVLGTLMERLENTLGKKFKSGSPIDESSPFGIESDWILNVEKAKKHDITCEATWDWLGPLVHSQSHN